MALAWVLVAALSIALPLGFIAVLLRLANRVPSRGRRAMAAVRLPGAPDLELELEPGVDAGLDGGLGTRL